MSQGSGSTRQATRAAGRVVGSFSHVGGAPSQATEKSSRAAGRMSQVAGTFSNATGRPQGVAGMKSGVQAASEGLHATAYPDLGEIRLVDQLTYVATAR